MREISKMTFCNFIFSNKKSLPYWGLLFFSFWFFLLYSYFTQSITVVYIVPLSAFPILLFFMFYFVSYFKYSKFFLLRKDLEQNNVSFLEGICLVEIFPKQVNINGFKNNFRSNIKLRSYKAECLYLTFDFGIVLIYYLKIFGVFIEYSHPLVILNSTKHLNVFSEKKRINIDLSIFTNKEKFEIINKDIINDNIEKIIVSDLVFLT